MLEERDYTIVSKDDEESKWRCKKNSGTASATPTATATAAAWDLELQFIEEDKESVLNAISACETTHLILVCNRDMKWQAKRVILSTTGMRIEVFTAEELMFNPLEGDYVPTHMLMTNGKELKDLLTRFPKDKLPIIDPRTDIVARFMGLRSGDVVKILRPVNQMLADVETRRIPHPSESVMYRVCRVSNLAPV